MKLVCLLFVIVGFKESQSEILSYPPIGSGLSFLCGCVSATQYNKNITIKCEENTVIQMEPHGYIMNDVSRNDTNEECGIRNYTTCENDFSTSNHKPFEINYYNIHVSRNNRIKVYKKCTLQNSCNIKITRVQTEHKRLVNYPFYCRSVQDLSVKVERSDNATLYLSGKKFIGQKINCDCTFSSSVDISVQIFFIHLTKRNWRNVKIFTSLGHLIDNSTSDTTLLYTSFNSSYFILEIRGMEPDVDDVIFLELEGKGSINCVGCTNTAGSATMEKTAGIQTTGIPTTGIPTTGIPTTGIPTTGIPTTGIPTTGIPTTGIPTTGIPTTGIPTTGIPTTGIPTTGIPTSGIPTTSIPNTGIRTTGIPTTGIPTSGIQTTGIPTTGIPTTGIPTTGIPISGIPTTGIPTTGIPTTGIPTTGIPTTDIPTTGIPTTGIRTTGIRTTGIRTTGIPTTDIRTTATESTSTFVTTSRHSTTDSNISPSPSSPDQSNNEIDTTTAFSAPSHNIATDMSFTNPTTTALNKPASTASADPTLSITTFGGILAAVIIINISGIALYCFIRHRKGQLACTAGNGEQSHYDYIDYTQVIRGSTKSTGNINEGQRESPYMNVIENIPRTNFSGDRPNDHYQLQQVGSGKENKCNTTSVVTDEANESTYDEAGNIFTYFTPGYLTPITKK